MDIRFQYSKKADKFLSKHEDVRTLFKADVIKLVKNDHPETVNYKHLQGKYKGYDRIAVNGYRVIFRFLRDDVIVVDTVKAGPRGDVYK